MTMDDKQHAAAIQDNEQFLRALSDGHFGQTWVCDHTDFTGGFARDKIAKLNTKEACYFSGALLYAGSTARDNKAFEAGFVIVLDDVGEKLSTKFAENFAPEPTYRIETSQGNEQWGYRIEPVETDAHRWKAFYALLRQSHFKEAADHSGLCAYKRLPFGLASKEGRKRGFKTKLTHFSPDITYTLDELAELLGFSLSDEMVATVRPPILVETACEPMPIDLLCRAVMAIPNDEAFAKRAEWIHMGHAIKGACGGDPRGRELFVEWSELVPQIKEDPGRAYDSLKPNRAGAGFIRKHLQMNGRSKLYAEAVGFAEEYERDTGHSDEEDPQGDTQFHRSFTRGAVQLVCAADVKMQSVNWLWDGYLAESMFHLLAGATTTGKTTTALTFAATVSTGGTWPDGTRSQKGNVLIWSGEDAIDVTLVPRLKAAGADLHKIFFIDGMEEDKRKRPFDPAKDMPRLTSRVQEIGGAKLLILDSVVSAIAGDSHKNTEVRRGLQPVVDLAAKHHMAVIGITHLTKNTQGKQAWERINGSLAFAALSRVNLFCVAREGDDGIVTDRTFVRVNSNIGPSGGGYRYDIVEKELHTDDGEIIKATHAQFGDAVAGSANAILAAAEGTRECDGENAPGRPDTELQEAIDFLIELLGDGVARPVADIRDTATNGHGIAWRTVERAKKTLGIRAFRTGNAWRWIYETGENDEF